MSKLCAIGFQADEPRTRPKIPGVRCRENRRLHEHFTCRLPTLAFRGHVARQRAYPRVRGFAQASGG
jgi:hypothetical protein